MEQSKYNDNKQEYENDQELDTILNSDINISNPFKLNQSSIGNYSNSSPQVIVDSFYSHDSRSGLPFNFHQRVVELENIILINNHHEEIYIEELASLYKNGVEYYSGDVSTPKQQFYFDKLMFLLTHKKVKKVIGSNTNTNGYYKEKTDCYSNNSKFSRSNSDVSFMSVKSNLTKSELYHKNRTFSRRCSRKVNIFFNNLKSKIVCHQKIENFENAINEGIEIIEEELENQTLKFQERLQLKRQIIGTRKGSFASINSRKSVLIPMPFALSPSKGPSSRKSTPRHSSKNLTKKNSSISLFRSSGPIAAIESSSSSFKTKPPHKSFIINKNDKFYPVIQDFIKKFQILYFKLIFEKAIDFTKNTYCEILNKKIEKFLRYEEDIKNYQMFKIMEEDETTKQSLNLLIKALELDRKTEILKYSEMTRKIFEKFIDKGIGITLSESQPFRDLVEETMMNLAKKFE